MVVNELDSVFIFILSGGKYRFPSTSSILSLSAMRVLPWCTEGMIVRGVVSGSCRIEKEMHKKRAITNSELGEIKDERLEIEEVKTTIITSSQCSVSRLEHILQADIMNTVDLFDCWTL